MNGEELIVRQLVRFSRRTKREHGSDRHDLAIIGFDQLPIAFMHQPVMPQAEEGEVWQITRSAMHPGDQVMAVAP